MKREREGGENESLDLIKKLNEFEEGRLIWSALIKMKSGKGINTLRSRKTSFRV